MKKCMETPLIHSAGCFAFLKEFFIWSICLLIRLHRRGVLHPGAYKCYAHRIVLKALAASEMCGQYPKRHRSRKMLASNPENMLKSNKCDVYWTNKVIEWYA